jgi:excisionase family DNA binding protein
MDKSELMTPAEVAKAFGVDPKTVTRWAKTGKLQYILTPGGHRKYSRAEIETYMKEGNK